MAIDIKHDLEINASAETVWQVLMNFSAYKDWNPFLLDCESTLKPGDPINLTVQLGKQVRQETEIMAEFNEGEGFAYTMKPPPLGALSSRRSHRIVPLDGGRCRYESSFHLEGWLAPVVKMAVGKHLQTGFDGMSYGVRDRAESLSG